MPHASEDGGAAGEDACSSDELIVFKDENGGEDVVKRSSDKVTEEKSDLIDLSESEKVSSNHRCSPVKTSSSTPDLNRSKPGPTPHPPAFNMGYLVAPYPSPYTNGTTSVSMVSLKLLYLTLL
ncbi:unnamed protein product [Macrosiphum euphorbiae]|uniref:CTNNB1 binding N-teminal domain-containing protein n=1 Tax=Macrosiphum euphorbiae TaxID=13131 RepID=A0AAV0WWD3_9HEMI|nr:unnamed protein product [Macrosiphum euphorbiae]